MVNMSRTDRPLAALGIFADAKNKQLERASSLLTSVTLGAGETLLRQGALAREFLIVADGLVSVSREVGDGTEVLAQVTDGDVLGEMSLLHGGTRSATVVTMVPTTVFVATPREFFALLEAVPSAAERIVRAADSRRRANLAA